MSDAQKNNRIEPPGKRRLAARFNRFNILVFLLALSVMAAVVTVSASGIIGSISSDYAGRFAHSSANLLGAHISKEVSLLSGAASSGAVVDWLLDENNEQKKERAYMELSNTINSLYSSSLYIVPAGTHNEYKVEGDYPYGGMTLVDTLDAADDSDIWFFDSLRADNKYILSIAKDDVSYGKRVWIDHKVILGGDTIGIIATGLEFPHIAGELFAHFDHGTTHGIVIDKDGIVYIDSSLLGDDDFLHNEYASSYETVYDEPALTDAVDSFLRSAGRYYGTDTPAQVIALTPRPYRYAAIAPIPGTTWLTVITYDSSSLLDVPLFLPAAFCVLAVLIIFALSVNAVARQLIFIPLARLRASLMRLKEDGEDDVYGIGRGDEIGELSGAIRDWFTKANYDALTGIYNRRFMESSLQSLLGILARTGGEISILMIDVDFFKKYNDTYGHEQGDVCLKSVAQAIASCAMRKAGGDFAARYGGEEFVLVLPNADKAGACMIADKALETVRALKLPHESSSAAEYVTISVGVMSAKVGYGHSWEEYLKLADEALYASKQNGRNRYSYSMHLSGDA